MILPFSNSPQQLVNKMNSFSLPLRSIFLRSACTFAVMFFSFSLSQANADDKDNGFFSKDFVNNGYDGKFVKDPTHSNSQSTTDSTRQNVDAALQNLNATVANSQSKQQQTSYSKDQVR